MRGFVRAQMAGNDAPHHGNLALPFMDFDVPEKHLCRFPQFRSGKLPVTNDF
jgi:hypothetical protein